MKYWIYLDEEVRGPYSIDELISLGVTPSTMICPEGTESWMQSADMPELSQLFNYPHTVNYDQELPESQSGIRKKIFIIHGRGIRIMDAFRHIISLLESKIYYSNGTYYTESKNLKLIRYLIYEESKLHTNKLISALDRLYISKLLIAPTYSIDISGIQNLSSLSQYKVNEKIKSISIEKPDLNGTHLADAVFRDSLSKITLLTGFQGKNHHELAAQIREFINSLEKDKKLLEAEAHNLIKNHIDSQGGSGSEFINGLLEVQRTFEQGGDLDTISSNALYGAWLLHKYKKEFNREPIYGVEYEFDFVNYQESFMHLCRHKNCDIYVPDFPLDAIPDLEESARALLNVGSIYKRFDDHHPWTEEAYNTLVRLKEEGVIKGFSLSGPRKGEEQPKEQQKCGGDLIYELVIKDKEPDNPGLAELRRLAHLQDLHIKEDKNAIDISKLIGSKHSKLDMVQRLMRLQSKKETEDILNITGWRLKVINYERELEQHCPKLLKNLVHVEMRTPVRDGDYYSKLPGLKKIIAKLIKILTFTLYDPSKTFFNAARSSRHNIYMALSPFQSSKEARINVASAIHYLKEKIDMDYFFYCYGSSLMTTRKINEMDSALDLGVLMSIIGTPEDGGHPSAATCKPSKNPYFPKEKFDKISYKNFVDYAGYISTRIREHADLDLVKIRKADVAK